MDKDQRRIASPSHRLFEFIHDEGKWMFKDENGGGSDFGGNEGEELELRLGPPGEEQSAYSTSFSNTSKGTKRGFLERIESNAQVLQARYELEKETSQRKNGRADDWPQKRSGAPVVGWPPIRSHRKNIAGNSKPTLESQRGGSGGTGKPESRGSKGLFVKINMEGVPIGRKINLLAYDSYEKLSSAVDELFRDLLAAQRNPLVAIQHSAEKQKSLTGLLDGSGEYALIYEDDEGDRMLVGDVPWDMFVSTAKRLRVLKSSELSPTFVSPVFVNISLSNRTIDLYTVILLIEYGIIGLLRIVLAFS
ncbi:Auxin-responsive protein IAA26 [Apostasia shenzhenica]|uniref:Auxin-responsive protein n=1 Tax=Apostasia shenzhenica TaxID=1088818 RepID=A0A2I0B9K2_9ASPA|nr:Auxin-responsive protein IAA26 [Apostasia shenzhenica]